MVVVTERLWLLKLGEGVAVGTAVMCLLLIVLIIVVLALNFTKILWVKSEHSHFQKWEPVNPNE